MIFLGGEAICSANAEEHRVKIGGGVTKAILFDLDDTLLDNSMKVFEPHIFQLLVEYWSHYVPAKKALAALSNGVQAMDANNGTHHTNEDLFVEAFCSATEIEPDEIKYHMEAYFSHDFRELAHLVHRLPEARPLVGWAIKNAFQVVIATGMQTPRAAVEHRLAWAGVPVTDFAYTFITTWDNMHASKPHPAYYQEILTVIARQPAECLMVGDDWENDILPATTIGIPSYWIVEPGQTLPAPSALLIGQGTLAEFFTWLREMARGGGGRYSS